MEPDFIAAPDLALCLSVSLRQVQRLTKKKLIPAYHISRNVRYRYPEVQAALARNFRVRALGE